jgi:hypothetical protein
MQVQFRFNFIPLVVVAIILFSSCSKTNRQGSIIPENALFAVVVNGLSFSNKLPWNEVKQNNLFIQVNADSSVPAFMKKVMDDPENSGIDTKKELIFYIIKDSIGGYAVFTGTLKDAEKFKLFALDATKAASENEKDGINFISKSPAIAAYSKEKFLCLINLPNLKKSGYAIGQDMPRSRDIASACLSAFNLNEKKSLGNNEKFSSLLNEQGDIHFWLNTGLMFKDMPGSDALSIFKMDKMYEGNITTGNVNFEDGKILLNTRSYTNREMAAIWKKYKGSGIDEHMIKSIPSKDVAALFALNFKPEGIREMLKVAGLDGMVTLVTGLMGAGLEDFIAANKGDVMIALMGLKPTNDSISPVDKDKFSSKLMNPDFIFSTSVGDKDAFNKLIKVAKKMSDKELGNDLNSGFTYNMNGKYFAIGNSKEKVDSYLAGGNNNFDFMKKLDGSPIAAYINLQYLMKSMESEAGKDSTDKMQYDLALKMWQDVFLTGGKISDDAMTMDAEINLLDKSTNSLKQLNQYMGRFAQLIKSKKDKFKEAWDKRQPNTVDLKDIKMEEIKPGKQVTTLRLPVPPVKKH